MSELASPQRGIVAPPIDADSAPFWAALERGAISLPKCNACGTIWFPPTSGCAICGAEDADWVDVRPTGVIYSWVVVNRSLWPEFAEEVPYVVATVALDDGPKLFARLFDVALDEIAADMRVTAVFYEVDGQRLLGFRPA
jgi:uncharacterized OB-fold protein